jgi:PiT family inorganic phosphate transporter
LPDIVLLLAVILFALVFDFFNGVNDCANAIATCVSTKALSPRSAITMAYTLNFLGALSHTAVAATFGKGIIDPESASLVLIMAALVGAALWTAIASYQGIPISVTHSLVGGLLGAGIAAAGTKIIMFGGVKKILLAMIFSPLAGFVGGGLLILLLYWAFRRATPHKINVNFRRLQVLSAAWMSFSHGMNDAQNAMGIITMALVTYGFLPFFKVPIWVMIACATAMALGTSIGGWRVIKTMGKKVFDLKPVHGFAAETSASIVISAMSLIGAPISTTHVISTAIMGVGSTKRLSAVRWGIVRNIVIAWIITIPAAGIAAAISYFFFNKIFG